MRLLRLTAVLCASVLLPVSARAESILFTGSGSGSTGVTLSASALFAISGSTLTVTLRNVGDTSGTSKDLAANTLTGVFFDLPNGISLTPVTATIAAGDLLQGNKCDVGPCTSATTNVGGEFVYKTGSFPGNADRGIASSGYINADMGGGNFNGSNLDNPNAPDGINFGIIAPITASNPFNPNNGNMVSNPLIEEQVVFTMTIAGGALSASQISNVSFQYGTDLSEPRFGGNSPPPPPPPPSIPEPNVLLLFGAGTAFAARRLARRKTQ